MSKSIPFEAKNVKVTNFIIKHEFRLRIKCQSLIDYIFDGLKNQKYSQHFDFFKIKKKLPYEKYH